MKDIINWCNNNQGFLFVILSGLTILVSILTIRITYIIGKMPYKKSIKIIPFLTEDKGKFLLDVIILNTGVATILINSISIMNNADLVIGHYGEIEPIALRSNDFIKQRIEIYDDIENIERNAIDLNNHIKVAVYGYNGEKYIQCKGFPVG